MKTRHFHRYPTSQDSLDSFEKPPKQTLLTFLVLGLTLVAGYAVYLGGTVITEVTPTYIRVEVVGKPK